MPNEANPSIADWRLRIADWGQTSRRTPTTSSPQRARKRETNPIPGMGQAMITPSLKDDYDEFDRHTRSEKQRFQLGGSR